MLETILICALCLQIICMAAWLTIGVVENIVHPFLNETFTALVLDMERMRAGYPEAYEHVAYRRLASRRTQRAFFFVAIFLEVVTVICLWAAVIALGASVGGWLSVEIALGLALIGATMFSSLWAGFLIMGNYFCYWFGHEDGQNTHFHMLHWGMAATLMVVICIVVVS